MPNRLEPPVGDASAPFWEATREKRLVLQWCRACDKVVHYPRAACPVCLSTDLGWRPASGRGEVYARVIAPGGSGRRRPESGATGVDATAPAGGSEEDRVIALVALEEGARFMTNIVGCAPADVAVGLPVTLTWEELSDGRHLPLFELAGGT